MLVVKMPNFEKFQKPSEQQGTAMTNKRQKFGCDPYLLEKKFQKLELVRVNYFLARP